jgi:phage shock protein C
MSEPKRLYRSTKNKVLGGVCAGIAEYFNIDPVIVRIIAVLLLFSGAGLIAYIVAWIIVPKNPKE